MKKIITIMLLGIFYQSSCQTADWHIADNFDHYGYSNSRNKIDVNNNVYTMYTSRETQYGDFKFHIEKYDSNGARVVTFGSNGVLNVGSLFSLSNNQYVFSFEITNDDKLLLLVGTNASSGYSDLYFLRINNDGTIDTSLNVTGSKDIYPDITKYSTHMQPTMIKVDDKYFILNNYKNILNASLAEISCFDDSGNLINTIFNQGNLAINYGASYAYSYLEKISYVNNYLYLVGRGYYTSTTYDRFISKIHSNTWLTDTSYGNNGLLLFNNKTTSLFQADGNIIEAKTVDISPAQQNLIITKYLSNGNIDTSFATNGILTLATSFIRYTLPKLYNLPNGDFFVHIRISLFASDQDAIIYVKNSGVLDTTFGGNIIDNGNPVIGTFGLPTFRPYPGSLSFGPNYFITTSERQPTPQSITTTKVNYTFPSLATNEYNQHKFQIIPNPSNFKITIESQEAFSSINLYDINGRLLKTSLTNNPVLIHQLDISDLSNGIYMLELKSGNAKQIQKLIKN